MHCITPIEGCRGEGDWRFISSNPRSTSHYIEFKFLPERSLSARAGLPAKGGTNWNSLKERRGSKRDLAKLLSANQSWPSIMGRLWHRREPLASVKKRSGEGSWPRAALAQLLAEPNGPGYEPQCNADMDTSPNKLQAPRAARPLHGQPSIQASWHRGLSSVSKSSKRTKAPHPISATGKVLVVASVVQTEVLTLLSCPASASALAKTKQCQCQQRWGQRTCRNNAVGVVKSRLARLPTSEWCDANSRCSLPGYRILRPEPISSDTDQLRLGQHCLGQQPTQKATPGSVF